MSAGESERQDVVPSAGARKLLGPAGDGRLQRGLTGLGGDEAAEGDGGTMEQRPIVKVLEGGGEGDVTGASVLGEVFELLAARLPRIPLSDPVRPHLAALAPLLGRELGRPRAHAAPEPRQRLSG